MVLNAASLNRRIQVRRFHETGTDGFGSFVGDWQDAGPVLFARRRDVSDAERLTAGRWGNLLVVRFVIRATGFANTITRDDQILHDGITFHIDGIKEVPAPRGFLEITARTDGAP